MGDDKGVEGDYKATSLAPSATWETSLNTGSFTWSYDMPVPEVPGGLKPKIGLSYSSGAIDGRTGGTNNQGSWAGDGFELWPGFIERRYKPCSDDGEKHADGNKPGDLCWAYDNAFLSFNGKAGELVPAGKDQWKLQADDGTRIRHLTSADRDNGDNDNEYWELIDPAGTRYYFGYHKLPGWSAGKETTEDANGAILATVYDGLGRKTELHDKTADGPLRAKWVYDTVAKGQLAESTRYIDGKPYTTKTTQYDPVYRPQRTSVVIPDSEGKLAGTYEATTAYYSNGLPMARSMSQVGSILGKGWNYSYADDTLRVTSVFGDGIRSDATYNLVGQPLTYRIGTSAGKPTQVTNTYEWGTRRLANSRVDRQDVAGVDKSVTYAYDPAGNITSLSDVSRSGTDTQCFTYDHLRRLTEAWTQSDKTCATAPVGNLSSGSAPYWQSYRYDLAGNTTTLTQHDPTGDAAKDTKSTYTYPKPGTPQPHTLTTVDTTTRTLHGDKQTLAWDPEGHLAKVAEPDGDKGTKATSYVYDADGNRLITRTDAKTTLTLADHTEATLDKGSDTPKATRYIPLADHQGTGQLAVNTTDQTLVRRRALPFGGPRGTQPRTWPGTNGFVGGTNDFTVSDNLRRESGMRDPTSDGYASGKPNGALKAAFDLAREIFPSGQQRTPLNISWSKSIEIR
ncbi:hypothetical protein ACFU7T_00130 [Streptomyces sp. NPDC057555]|uniref:hypothetical protein n=1 Tax=Streptomyces sp. NPDC057555 TaxID=3346166 RepID=UPI003675C5F2